MDILFRDFVALTDDIDAAVGIGDGYALEIEVLHGGVGGVDEDVVDGGLGLRGYEDGEATAGKADGYASVGNGRLGAEALRCDKEAVGGSASRSGDGLGLSRDR